MDKDDTIATLNKLIETSKDGELGFRASAEHLQDAPTRLIFTRRAEECHQAAAELQTLVVHHGGSAEEGGSASGALHRGWAAMKTSMSKHTDRTILEEAESAEDRALERYRDALEDDLPPAVLATVQRQYEGVKRNHAQIRMLRDQARAMTA